MTSDLLARPPEEGARLIALSYLDKATEALHRLKEAEDKEALHDFRVALRRLRSCLRAYRGLLQDSVPKKLAKRLRRLARATPYIWSSRARRSTTRPAMAAISCGST